MKIAVVGAGNVGGALAGQWAKTGHEVALGVRDAQSDDVKKLIGAYPGITAMSVAAAAEKSEVILVAVPISAARDVAEQLGDVNGKVIIDATNAVMTKPAPYNTVFEFLKKETGCEDVVKCFNSTGYENMTNPRYGDVLLDMFMAGDSQRAKRTARQLARDAGFEDCHDFGGDDKVQLLEHFALSWINLAIMQKMGRHIAFKLIKR